MAKNIKRFLGAGLMSLIFTPLGYDFIRYNLPRDASGVLLPEVRVAVIVLLGTVFLTAWFLGYFLFCIFDEQ